MFNQLRTWGADRSTLNATHVEQKLEDFANEKAKLIHRNSNLTYELLREDNNECLELFGSNLSEKLDSDVVSRLIGFYRIVFGTQTEIQSALVNVQLTRIGYKSKILCRFYKLLFKLF